MHRLNRKDESDVISINFGKYGNKPCFGISCDDSWALIGKSIYALTGEDSFQLDREMSTVDWHPTDPNRLVGVMEDGNLYLYDLGENKWCKAKANPYKLSSNTEVRYSPDCENIAFTSKVKESEWANYALWLFDFSD